MLRLLLFITGIIAAGISAAEDATPCSPDIVPIQIIDRVQQSSVITLPSFKVGMGSKRSLEFNSPVGGIMEHIATRLAEENLCQDIAKNKEHSLVQFVDWPITVSKSSPPAPVLATNAHSTNGCQITSPWLDLAFEREPVPRIHAIVRWSARQLLTDQAMLVGAKNVPPGIAMPLIDGAFSYFANDYAKSEIRGEQMETPVTERISPDLLWLFRRSPQKLAMNSFGGASDGLEKVQKKGKSGYTKLILALIDRCFDSNGETLHYDSILDAKDLIPLEEYKIDTLI
ncbi:MAG: hypothetical protein LBE24_08875 [Methylobacillus sp.]|jgi:hypothetical protein|nr:hypothetical protein [Methylobacillus sp.]